MGWGWGAGIEDMFIEFWEAAMTIKLLEALATSTFTGAAFESFQCVFSLCLRFVAHFFPRRTEESTLYKVQL